MDENKLIFSSEWQIGQVLDTAQVTVSVSSAADVLLKSFSGFGLTYMPRCLITWKKASSTRWQMNGAMDTGSNVFAKIKSGGLYISTYDFSPISVNVRYIIYTDRVDVT